jgi:hypothetical protein
MADALIMAGGNVPRVLGVLLLVLGAIIFAGWLGAAGSWRRILQVTTLGIVGYLATTLLATAGLAMVPEETVLRSLAEQHGLVHAGSTAAVLLTAVICAAAFVRKRRPRPTSAIIPPAPYRIVPVASEPAIEAPPRPDASLADARVFVAWAFFLAGALLLGASTRFRDLPGLLGTNAELARETLRSRVCSGAPAFDGCGPASRRQPPASVLTSDLRTRHHVAGGIIAVLHEPPPDLPCPTCEAALLDVLAADGGGAARGELGRWVRDPKGEASVRWYAVRSLATLDPSGASRLQCEVATDPALRSRALHLALLEADRETACCIIRRLRETPPGGAPSASPSSAPPWGPENERSAIADVDRRHRCDLAIAAGEN